MIKNANLNPEQVKVIKEICAIQIDVLISSRINVSELRLQFFRENQEKYTENELLKVIDDLMNAFNELRHNPQTLLSFPQNITDQIQIIMGWYIDKYDGDENINGIYAKFFQSKDFRQEIISLN